MRYLSLCSGIEAASVAWHPLGWTPVAFAEIEKFPSAVLKHHYPDVPNWGDMTKYQEWPDADVDVLVAGTPCQSYSVAGLRKGLDDPRGNLMLTFGAIAKRYRPRWLVWENVPGVLSTNQGRDFGTFLGMLGELGYGFSYRVLDAQFTRTQRFPRAVPQRRRRVFLVGYLGDWRPAAAVFLERESVAGNPPPQRKARQAAQRDSAPGVGGSGIAEVCGALTDGAHNGGGLNGQDAYTGRILPVVMGSGQTNAPICEDGSAPTLTCLQERPLVAGALDARHAGGFQSVQSASQGHLIPTPTVQTFSTPAIGDIREDDIASTVTRNSGAGGETQNPAFVMQPVAHSLRGEGFDASEDGTGRGTPLVPVAICTDMRGHGDGDIAPTLRAKETANDFAPMVAQPVAFYDYLGSQGGGVEVGVSPTLKKKDGVAVTQPMAFSDVGATLKGGSGERGHPDPSDGNGHNIVAQPVAFTRCDNGQDAAVDVTPTMRCGSNYSAHLAVAQPVAIPIHDQATRHGGKRGDKQDGKGNGLGVGEDGDPAPTLTKGDKHAVAQQVAVGFNWQNAGGYGNANEGLGVTVEGTGPLQRCQTPAVAIANPSVFPIDTQNMTEGHQSGGLGYGQDGDPSFTLTKGHSHGVAVARPMAFKVRGGVECEDGSRGSTNIGKKAGKGFLGNEERAFTVAKTQDQWLAQPVSDAKQVQWASGGGQIENDTAQALRSGAEHNYQFARVAMQVRRLTPRECERLQAFPDDYTLIPWRNGWAADGPRYKALGNSMAVNCMDFIGQRIALVEEVLNTAKSRPEFTADRSSD